MNFSMTSEGNKSLTFGLKQSDDAIVKLPHFQLTSRVSHFSSPTYIPSAEKYFGGKSCKLKAKNPFSDFLEIPDSVEDFTKLIINVSHGALSSLECMAKLVYRDFVECSESDQN